MQYDDIIKKLKDNSPVSTDPAQLTDRIMRSIGNSFNAEDHFRVHPLKWGVINSMRLILSAAAIFLIVFFIIEQNAINSKLDKLEESLVEVRYTDLLKNYQNVRYEEIREVFSPSSPTDSMKEVLQINRQTLNYLQSRIKELESENLSLREMLNKLYPDSITNQFQIP